MKKTAKKPAAAKKGGKKKKKSTKKKSLPPPPDVSIQHSFLDAAKTYNWPICFAMVEEHPGVVNVQPAGRYSALHQAAVSGSLDAVQFFVAHGAQRGALTKDGRTPLDLAADRHPAVADFLQNGTYHPAEYDEDEDDEEGSNSDGEAEPGRTAAPNADELRASCSPLKSFLLSAAASPAPQAVCDSVTELSDESLVALLKRHVPGVDGMLSRDGCTQVAAFITATYRKGLPLYQSSPSVQAQLVQGIRYVFWKVNEGTLPQAQAASVLTRLAEAYQACQAVQGRVIDTLFGELSGRDQGAREQVLAMGDVLKERALDEVANTLNPNAWKQGDECPQLQLPHILSSYRVALGPELGLSGVEAARCDHCAPHCDAHSVARVRALLFERFDEEQLVAAVVEGVNHPQAEAEHQAVRLSREALAQWAGAEAAACVFDPYQIYWDESRAEEYGDLGRPRAEEEYEPFLSYTAARALLNAMLLGSNTTV